MYTLRLMRENRQGLKGWIGFLRRFIILEIRGFFKNLFVEGIQKYIYLWAMGVCRDVVRRLIGKSTSCSDFKKNLKSFSKCIFAIRGETIT